MDRRRSDDLPCGSVLYSEETAFFDFPGAIFVMYASHEPDHMDFASEINNRVWHLRQQVHLRQKDLFP